MSPSDKISSTKNPSGLVLLPILMLVTLLTLAVMGWYQWIHHFRGQSETSLRYQFLHQELSGIVAQSILELQHYRPNELETTRSILESQLPDGGSWQVKTISRGQEQVALNLVRQSPQGQLKFEALFSQQKEALTTLPWVVFAPYPDTRIPTFLHGIPESLYHSPLSPSPFYLRVETPSETFQHSFFQRTVISVLPGQLRIQEEGNPQFKLVPLTEITSLYFDRDVDFQNTASMNATKRLYLSIKGNLRLHFTESNLAFFGTGTPWFVHLNGNLMVEQEHPVPNQSLEVNGFFWIEGESCLSSQQSVDLTWKGSLACRHAPVGEGIQSLTLQHTIATNVPASFLQNSLKLQGIRFKS